ncbi:MAG: hypothetical protein JNL74_22995, partial [Fibrobacteres bacterium]|nr:hypothetical protein [Fibrobacterota bacterium]
MKDKRMNRIRGTVRSAHFSPDGLFLVAANIDGCLKSWKTADWSMVSHLPADKKRLGPGMQKNIAFLNNDLVLTNEHKGIFCWNYKTGKTSPFLSDDDLCMDSYSICKNVYALLIWRKYLKQTIDPDEYLDFSDDRSIVEIRNINTQNIHKQWVLDDVFFNVAQISPCGQFYILQDANEKSTAGVFLT